jgi:hypothetical protein
MKSIGKKKFDSVSSKFEFSRLGGVMVCVPAIGPNLREFKPGRGVGLLRAI